MHLIRLFCFASLAVAAAMGSGPARSEESRTPVLIELFTSQSCSSCPPAEELIQGLYRRKPVPGVEILTLSEHVDYWDGLGWKDPYSSVALTDRQRGYSLLGRVYTPQAIIGGRIDAVGSDAAAVLSAVKKTAQKVAVPLQLTLDRNSDDLLTLTIGRGFAFPPGFRCWAAVVQDGIVTAVHGGENGGSTLREDGVVRSLQVVTQSARNSIALPAGNRGSGEFRVIVFLQKESGDIVAAGQATVPGR